MSIEELLQKEKVDITDSQMGELGAAAQRLVKQQEEILALEEAVKAAKAAERRISEEEIPELMDNLGFSKITLATGQTLQIKDTVHCSITAANKPRAYVWLDENGHGSLIKSQITCKFARGESDMADEAFEALIDVGANPNQVESVHPGTLKAWAREEINNGRDLPANLFNVHLARGTTIK